ncbi:hypothetical protein MHBO_000262 [Bonamia ostreae]|uniref:Uncharacterized protein n=1 Tax=Bonamia ostreae TaxID=126728 RepID=A0ABV2AF52_9EUKA
MCNRKPQYHNRKMESLLPDWLNPDKDKIIEFFISLLFFQLSYIAVFQNIVRIRNDKRWFYESLSLRTYIHILTFSSGILLGLVYLNFLTFRITQKAYVIAVLRCIAIIHIITLQFVGLKNFLDTIKIFNEPKARIGKIILIVSYSVYVLVFVLSVILLFVYRESKF